MEIGNELITKKELARRLKVTTRTLTSWNKQMKLPHFKNNSRIILYDWKVVMAYLVKHYGKNYDIPKGEL